MRGFLLGCISLVYVSCTSPSNTAKQGVLEVISDSLNLGKIKLKDTLPIIFRLKNIGIKPLRLKSSGSSCECSKPFFSDTVINPNNSSTLKVLFYTSEIGMFNKSVVLETDGTPTYKVLTFYGILEK